MTPTTRRLTTLAAAGMATLALGATAASAAVTVDDTTPTDGQSLTATVSSPPAGATQYTLSECNVTDPDAADWGRDCNRDTAVGFTPVATTQKPIVVNSAFENHSFVPGLPPQFGASTTCGNAGSPNHQCGVVVSWYNAAFSQLATQKADITF